MKMAYATVTAITSQDREVFGFLKGVPVSRHDVSLTEVTLSGGFSFPCLGRKDKDGALVVQGHRIEKGDRVQVMALPCGTVVRIAPEAIAHLPASELVHQIGVN